MPATRPAPRRRRTRRYLLAAAALVVTAALSGCGIVHESQPSGPAAARPDTTTLRGIVAAELRGQIPASVKKQLASTPHLGIGQVVPGFPRGLPASPADRWTFTKQDIARIRAKHYTAAIAMHLLNDAWPQLQVEAITTELKRFGIKVVAVTDANFNASTQINNVETLIGRKPDLLFSIPVDPTTEGSTYKQVSRAGIRLVLLDGVPSGLRPGKDFVSVVSGNNRGNAEFATKEMLTALHGKGRIGHLGVGYYFFTASIRDEMSTKLLRAAPGVKIVDGTFSEPTKAAYNEASGMLLAHPDMTGMWAAWDTAAAQVVAAERAQGRRIYLATSDLGAVSGLQMAQGYIHAIGAQQPYRQGVNEADAAVYSLLGKKVPPYVEVPTVPVTIETLLPAYKLVLHTDPPANLIAALKKTAGLA